MALVALEIPKVGLVMENARLVRWLKNVGDAVQQGEPLLELETEKSVVEIEVHRELAGWWKSCCRWTRRRSVGDRIAWLENDARAGTSTPGRTAGLASGHSLGCRAASPVPTSARRD